MQSQTRQHSAQMVCAVELVTEPKIKTCAGMDQLVSSGACYHETGSQGHAHLHDVTCYAT